MNSHTRTLDVRHTCEELAVVQTLVELEKAKGDNYAMIIIIPLPLPPPLLPPLMHSPTVA